MMTMPSPTSSPEPTVTLTCPKCEETRSAPEGDRVPACSCRSKRPSEQYPPTVYRLAETGEGGDFPWYAVSLPMGQRPVSAYGETRDQAVNRVVGLLDAVVRGTG